MKRQLRKSTFNIRAIFALMLLLSTVVSYGQSAYIPNAGDSTVSVIDLATNTVTTTISVGVYPEPITVSTDGSRVYVGNTGSNSISVINTATKTVVSTIALTVSPVALCVSPNGQKLYVTNSSNNNVSVINTTTSAVITTIPVGTTPRGMAISPDGKKIYVANSGSATISVIDSTTNAVTATIIYSSMPWALCMKPDGTRLYAVNTGSGVSEINTATNYILGSITVPAYTDNLAISANGNRICSISGASNAACIIDPHPIYPLYTSTVDNWPGGVDLSPDGTKVYVTSRYGNVVKVISTATYSVIATIPVGNGPAAFGKFIAFNQNTDIVSEQKETNRFSIYPNPFSHQTNVAFEQAQKNVTVQIMNVVGQEIKSFQFSGTQLSLDKGELKEGIYLLQITDENKVVVSKRIQVQ